MRDIDEAACSRQVDTSTQSSRRVLVTNLQAVEKMLLLNAAARFLPPGQAEMESAR